MVEGRLGNFIKLIHEWGGVTIVYRRSMQESPAYLHNHEELRKALEEGIFYLEGLEPKAVQLDEHGYAETLICYQRLHQDKQWITTSNETMLSARSILVATGTQPNTAYEFEHKGNFQRINLQYQHHEDDDGQLSVAENIDHCKNPQFGPFTSYQKDHYRVSLVGDTHPVFHGSVVKAIASGMRTYPKIVHSLQVKPENKGNNQEYQAFAQRMQHLFHAHVVSVTRHTANIIELAIRAPLAAQHFQAGQFYRLQNFETYAPRLTHTLLQMEPLALVATECDTAQGILHFIVLENTAAAKLCAVLKPGEPVSLMGPTGVRAKIASEPETILIIGNQSSFAFLRSYGSQLRTMGHRVMYVGQFNHRHEVFCQAQLENAADIILWLTQQGDPIQANRQQDKTFRQQSFTSALINYEEETDKPFISLAEVDRIFVVGDTELLRQFQAARSKALKKYLLKKPKAIGSVYGNMQCMLKGVCAQCLQWQIDPETGQRTKAVFACSWQDQPLEMIDIDHIDARQRQNLLMEQINNLWVDHLFKHENITRI